MGEEYRKNVLLTNNLDEIYNTVSGFIQILRYENVEDIHFYRNYDALVDFICSDKLALVKRCAFVFRDDCVKYYDYEEIKQVRSVVLQCNKYIDAYNSIASLLELGDCEKIWRSRYWGVLQALGFDDPITGEDIYADWFQWEHFGIDPDECSGFIIFELYYGNDNDNVVAADAVSGDGDLPGDSEAQAATTVINADVVATDAVSGDGDLSGGVEVQAAKTVTSAGQVFSAVVGLLIPPPPPPPPAASAASAASADSAASAALVKKAVTDKIGNRALPPAPKDFTSELFEQIQKKLRSMRVATSEEGCRVQDNGEWDNDGAKNGAAHTEKSV